MNKIKINEAIKRQLQLSKEGYNSAMLGIGPMSDNLIRATIQLGKEKDCPVMFIASRNQVDSACFGYGYVCGWDQVAFSNAIKQIAKEEGFDGLCYLCRDHGGPWQRDKERNDHLPEPEAMEIAVKSYIDDIKAGFDLLHIDPTKDPFEMGKVIPLDTVLNRTIYLIETVEKERIKLGLDEIAYEVGTEETNGGLTDMAVYESFIIRLTDELKKKNLPLPIFIVGQTGTLTRKTENVGHYSIENAIKLSSIANKYNVAVKEHNGDYLSDEVLITHLASGIGAVNVAPEYGTAETLAYLELCKVEKDLKDNNLLDSTSNLKEVMATHAINCGRWKKWMLKEQANLTVEEIFKDETLTQEILEIAGHYTFNDQEVKDEINKLYANLAKYSIDGNRYVVNAIKRSIGRYMEDLNMEGLTSKLLNK